MIEKIACFTRPWHWEYFPLIAKAAFPEAEVIRWHFGEFDRSSTARSAARACAKVAKARPSAEQTLLQDYPELDIDDVIPRCRQLRKQSRSRACQEILACLLYFDTLFEHDAPSMIYGPLIDDYSTHLLCWLAQRNGIDYYSLVGSVFPKRANVFCNGFRPTKGELDAPAFELAVNALTKTDYVPDYQKFFTDGSAWKNRYFRWQRNTMRMMYYWARMKMFPNDINPHTKQSYYASSYNFNALPSVRIQSKPIPENTEFLYLVPLNYYPESSIDYLTDFTLKTRYEVAVVELIGMLAKVGNVLVREHPTTAGMRDTSLYKQIEAIPNAYLSDLSVNARHEMHETEYTVVVSSSLASESYTVGRKGMAVVSPFFDMDGTVPTFDIDDVKGLEAAQKRATELQGREVREVVKDILRSYFSASIEGAFSPIGHANPMNEEEKERAHNLGQKLREFHEHRIAQSR